MASDRSALRRLAGADPVPAGGRDLVRYMGGTERAAQILSGMDRGPSAAERRADPEGTREAYNTWRAAQRQAQRWAKGERGTGDVARTLDGKQRRAAQAENRERKRTAARAGGIRARVRARVVINSTGSGRRDSRHRTIGTHGPDGRPGILVEGSPAIMAAVARGDWEQASELLLDGFLEAAGMPAAAFEEGGAGTTLEAPQWTLWADGEPAP